MMRKTTGECYRDIYRQFKGEAACGFFKFAQPALILRDPDLVRTIMVKEFLKFHKNEFEISESVDPLMAINPFTIGELNEWKRARTIQLPAQTLSKVRTMAPDMVRCSRRLTNFIREHTGKEMEAKTLTSGYTSDTVAACAFGLNSNSFVEGGSAFNDVSAGEIFRSTWRDNLAVVCAMFAPFVGRLMRFRIISKDIEELFIKAIGDVVKFRKSRDVRKNDFIQQMIDANSSGKPAFDEVEMAAHSMTFYMDGYETTSILLSFTLYELARNQDIQQQLRDEIFTISSDIGDFNATNIHTLVYLDNVLSECLRLHPPIQQVVRTCTSDTTVTCGGKEYKFRAGMTAVVPILALHTDPEHFPDPELFRPERFAKENKHLIRKFTYIPYGEGPRICVGMRFAMTQIKLAVAAILLEFHVTLAKERSDDLKLDPMSTFLHTAKDGLWLKFEEL
ncbi:hypothetical protein GE061_005991 [Apolygus lucorum]|uniref:Cytochrome P450 n=1 Tax=Apolygus lucorum TaxID=248454 RepID=A0A8S9WSQ3_APOLU|nr:hypothetical protein GE061_005991 [Apolygus lucorum]